MVYEVKLDVFEGPLDLLLHLINKMEIDIFDIPIKILTEQYIDYLHSMQKLELNIAAEYLVMASTLLLIKSKMILPVHEEIMTEEEYEDPRDTLVQQLVEYQQFKQAASQLSVKKQQREQLFSKAPTEVEIDIQHTAPLKMDIALLVQAFERVMNKQLLHHPLEKLVHREEIEIDTVISELQDKLQSQSNVSFNELVYQHRSRAYTITLFLAILELLKQNQINIEERNEEIYILK